MPRLFALALALGISLSAPFSTSWANTPLSEGEIKALQDQAENDNMKAQVDLAKRFFNGDGVKQDYRQAARWYQKLAEKEVVEAQFTLGLMYIRGDGVNQDNEKAVHWLTLAAEQRLPDAQYLLGVAHAEGHGVKKDLTKAYMWYEIAASLEHKNASEAQTLLAKKLSADQISQAEQLANEWWMRFHH